MNSDHTVITIDFWNTLVDAPTNGKRRTAVRMEALRETVKRYRDNLTQTELDQAYRHASDEYNRFWFNEERTLTTRDLIGCMFRFLDINPEKKEIDYLIGVFHQSIYEGPPDLAEGVAEIIPKLAYRFPLAIISDTMFSPGIVLREYLKRKGLFTFFRSFVFSDETGFSKPNIGAFRKALDATGCEAHSSYHIGDIHRTDVVGAHGAGMKSILYTGVSERDKYESDADYIIDSWDKIGELLLD